MLPDEFALVGRQTVHVAVVRSHVEAIVDDDRTSPESILLFRPLIQSAFCFVSPDQLAAILFVTANDSVFSGGVNKAINNSWRRVGIHANARLPNDRAILLVQTEQIARF